MKVKFLPAALLTLVLVQALPSVAADTRSVFESRFSRADAALVASVCEIVSRWETVGEFGDTHIVSRATLCDVEVLKGSAEDIYVLRIPTGTVDGLTQHAETLPLLDVSNPPALFLLTRRESVAEGVFYELTSEGQGYFTLQDRHFTDYVGSLAVPLNLVRNVVRAASRR